MKGLMRAATAGCAAVTAAFLGAGVASAQDSNVTSATLDAVKARGVVNCGVIGTSAGFSLPDSQGVMRGIDADQCRAIAAAVLGDANKVKFVVLTVQQRFTGLQSGEVDALYANVTWTMSRQTQLGLAFPNVYYYDGEGFIVKKSLGVKSALDLNGATVCLLTGGTGELTLQDYFSSHGMTYQPVLMSEGEQARAAFLADRCDAYSSDASALAAFKARQGDKGDELVVLPERLTNEPLAGAVRKGDERWFDIVQWTYYAMVEAEALKINSDNIDSFKDSTDPRVRRFLGIEGDLGKTLGLGNDFAYNVVKQVGNFGQMWDRDIVGVDRGQNNIWLNGGLHYAPPFR